jgi:hypothetical protein
VKYKKCCVGKDEKAWCFVAQLRHEAETVSAVLPRFNRLESDEDA